MTATDTGAGGLEAELRNWPAKSDRGDALNAKVVGSMMTDAADALALLRTREAKLVEALKCLTDGRIDATPLVKEFAISALRDAGAREQGGER